MSTTIEKAPTDLPPDNATRMAIYDAMHDGDTVNGASLTFTEDQVFERVIRRLRMLVPRELHLAGEREYVAEKLEVCAEAGLLLIQQETDGHKTLRLSGQPPEIRLPDGTIGDYSHDLEPARERIDRDNAALRAKGFSVRDYIPSIADDPSGPEFRALVASMEEHGFLRQFWIAQLPDGEIVDGLARKRAAEAVGIDPLPTVTYPAGREGEAARRRDSPLNRIAIAIDTNRARLDQRTIDRVHNEVHAVTGRPWEETAKDLEITREWRKILPKDYVPMLEVHLHAFRDGEDPNVQVTPDGRVMLRSLIVAAGLSSYKVKNLEGYVPMESARTEHSSRKALFARAQDIVDGIAALQQHQATRKNAKVDPQWDRIGQWLEANVLP